MAGKGHLLHGSTEGCYEGEQESFDHNGTNADSENRFGARLYEMADSNLSVFDN